MMRMQPQVWSAILLIYVLFSHSIAVGHAKPQNEDTETRLLVTEAHVRRTRLVRLARKFDLWRSPEFEPDLVFDAKVEQIFLDPDATEILDLHGSERKSLVRMANEIVDERTNLAPHGSYQIMPFGPPESFFTFKESVQAFHKEIETSLSKQQLQDLRLLVALRCWCALRLNATRVEDFAGMPFFEKESVVRLESDLSKLRKKIDSDELTAIVEDSNDFALQIIDGLLPDFVDMESLPSLPPLPLTQLLIELRRARDVPAKRLLPVWNRRDLGEDGYYFDGIRLDILPLGRISPSRFALDHRYSNHESVSIYRLVELSHDQSQSYSELVSANSDLFLGNTDPDEVASRWKQWTEDKLLPQQRQQLKAYNRLHVVFSLNPVIVRSKWELDKKLPADEFNAKLTDAITRLEERIDKSKKAIRKLATDAADSDPSQLLSILELMDYEFFLGAFSEKPVFGLSW